MKLVTFLGLVSKKLDKIVSSDKISDENLRSAKRIKSLEKNLLSQGKFSASKYAKLAEAVRVNEIDISNKAINDSVRSRIKNKKEFYPINEILSGISDDDIILNTNRLDFTLLHEIGHFSINDSFYTDIYPEFVTFVDEVEIKLIYKRLIRSLLVLKSKTSKLLKTFIQIPIIASLLEFFDQVSTFKEYEITHCNFYDSFFNVKTNQYRNGQTIHRIIPVTS